MANKKKPVNRKKKNVDKPAEMKSCFERGQAHFVNDRLDDSIRLSKRGLDIAEKLNNEYFKLLSSHLLMLAHRKLESNDNAILYGKKCIEASHSVGDKRIEMFASFVVGKLYFSKDQFEKAAYVCERGVRCAIEIGNAKYQAMIYLLLQDCYFRLKKYQDAECVGEKCRKVSKAIGDTIGETKSYLILSKSYQSQNQTEDSINAGMKAIDVETQDQDIMHVVKDRFETGKMLYEKRNFRDAVTHFKMSLKAAEKGGFDNTHIQLALASNYYHDGNNNCALTHGLSCLANAKRVGDKHAIIDVFKLLADIFLSMKQNDQALLNINKAVAFMEETGFKVHEEDIYFQQGDAYKSLLKYKDAIKSFEKCLAVSKEKGNKEREKQSYFKIGNSYEFMNNYEKAIDYGNKYMEISKEMGDEEDELEAYLALGVAHLGLDQYDRAYSYLMKGKELAKTRGEMFLVKQFDNFLEKFSNRIGMRSHTCSVGATEIVAAAGDMILVRNIEADESDSDVDDQTQKEASLFKKYADLRSKGELEEAIIYMRKYLQEYEHHPHYHANEKVYCILNIAEMHCTLEQFDKALQCCQEGLKIASKVKVSHLQAKCHLQAGQVLSRRQEHIKAVQSYKKSIHFVEMMFDTIGDHEQEDEFKISLLDIYNAAYHGLELAYIHTKQLKEALIVADNRRARSLKDLLQKYGMQESESAKESKLQFKHVQELVSTNSYSILLYSVGCLNCAGFYTFRVDKEYGLLFSAEARRPDRSIPITDIISNAYVEIQGDQVVQEENGSTDAPENALTALHRLLLDKCMRSIKDNQVVFSHGCELSQDEIVFIPEQILFMVPFAALKDPDTGQYLSETKRIRIAPSIATLKLLSDRPKEFDCKSGALIIGDPSVGTVICDGKEREFSSLFMAKIEAIAISNLLRVDPLTQENATKAAVLEKLRQGVSVVHIAAHGDTEKASIVLAPSPEVKTTKVPEEEDYMLTMADVQKTKVRAQLVVLSCCQSGLGEIKSEGMVSMCRAFLAAGARAVVGSLWSIDDDATREFMIQFYLNLHKRNSASLSLQLAMKYMMKTKEYNQPFYWAPFFLMGDDVTISF